MSAVGVGERLLRRLRAHKLLPPGVPAELRRLGRSGKSWSWYAIDARTGELLKVASYETMEACVNAPQWEVERDRHGFITVRPAGSEQTEAEQHESDGPGQRGARLRALAPHRLPPDPPERGRARLPPQRRGCGWKSGLQRRAHAPRLRPLVKDLHDLVCPQGSR